MSYGSFTLPELRTELKKRKAKISGRKKELIERLESYDRNHNFGQPEESIIEYHMTLPDPHLYSDINSDKLIPKIDICKIKLYLETFDKTLQDVAKSLYREKYLTFMRSYSDGNHFFVRSSCRAEMKKHVTYLVDISIQADGHVDEAQCECASGMGPTAHCKHVCAVLYACSVFQASGIVRVEETCTQRLQSFHKVKKFRGSPLKACDINLPGSSVNTFSTFDPRPNVYRNNPAYGSYFQNICLNFKGISKVPIFQIFTPANARAVAHDHDYLQYTPEYSFLQHLGVCNITDAARENIQCKTMGQSCNQAWQEERLLRIQSSSFGRVCKATHRTDFSKLATSMMIQRKIQSEAINHGKKYEQEAIRRYENDHDVTVHSCGIFVGKSHSFLGATPDGVIDGEVICEAKCPYTAKDKVISPITVPYIRTNESTGDYTLDKNHDYYYQIQGQLLCSERLFCDLIVYTLADVKYIRIERDGDFIVTMLQKLQSFYNEFFEPALLEKYFYKSY